MSAQSVILQGRVFNESLMTSTGIVRRANGGSALDPVTFVMTPTYDTIYTGPSKLRFPDAVSTTGAVPGLVVTDQAAILSLPVGVAGSGNVITGDIWECTSNPLDTSLVGKRVRVTGVHAQTSATARRFPVIEVS